LEAHYLGRISEIEADDEADCQARLASAAEEATTRYNNLNNRY